MLEATNSYKSLNTILPYFNVPVEDYWHINYKVSCTKDFFDYYWDLREKYSGFTGKYDTNKIPLYIGADGLDYYSVIFLGHYALGAYQCYKLDNSLVAKNDFINVCNWLLDNFSDHIECSGLWLNKYSMKLYGLDKEWVSCLCQAKGISALARAYDLTNDRKYLDGAIKAAKSFFLPCKLGGVASDTRSFIFFEEYPNGSDTSVLNGHIFALWSINDLLFVLRSDDSKFSKDLKALYNKAVDDLSMNLNVWDCGYWSKYDAWDKHENISSIFYHDLHIKQLMIMYKLTGNYEFSQVALRWSNYRSKLSHRLFSLFRKIYFRLCGRL